LQCYSKGDKSARVEYVSATDSFQYHYWHKGDKKSPCEAGSEWIDMNLSCDSNPGPDECGNLYQEDFKPAGTDKTLENKEWGEFFAKSFMGNLLLF